MNRKLKLIYFADGPWAHNAFDRIQSDPSFSIKMVLLRFDSSDEVLRKKADNAGIEVLCPENVNDSRFIESLECVGADLGVSMSYNQIIKKELLDVFPNGVINCHAGKLPHYRGRNVLNWALINDEKEIGVTCHYIDEGIDTGDIILQKTFPVTDEDDYGTVLEKAFEVCPSVLVESMRMINDGIATPEPQPNRGSYFIERRNGDEFIDWNWPSRQIFNFVRAITEPGPCARSWINIDDEYKLIIIKRAKQVQEAVEYNCVTGAIVGKSEEANPLVKTGDTIVEITEYEIKNNPSKKLKIGDRLGLNHNLMMLNHKERALDAELSKKLNSL